MKIEEFAAGFCLGIAMAVCLVGILVSVLDVEPRKRGEKRCMEQCECPLTDRVEYVPE